ncbi:MAG TPA: sialidase family protein [Roseiflexaceae bacterium]|nr:sialidase family protein [Roseiflexaceae bacterium]
MKRHGCLSLALVTLLSLLVVAPAGPSVASAAPASQFETSALAVGPGFMLPDSDTTAEKAGKYPSIVGSGTGVHMVANPEQSVQYWAKLDTAASAGGPTRIGSSKGDTDYTEAAIAAAPNGTLYAVYIVQNSNISLRRKLPGGNWESPRAIHRTSSFMSYADIAVTPNGQIFVVWNQASAYRFVRSTDGGATWSSWRSVSSKQPYKPIFITAGANNQVMAAFGGGDGHAYAAIWNGVTFNTTDVTPSRSKTEFFAFAKPAIAPNGKMYVAYSTPDPGGALYYAERLANGAWGRSRLARGAVYGAIGIHADAQSNLHLTWTSNISGRWQLYYTFKPVAGDWQPILRATGVNNRVIADVDASSTIGARVYNHAVFETFDGDKAALRYQQFSADSSVLSARPVLDNGALVTKASSVSLSFADVSGAPDSVRYRWNAFPTDANPWVPFASPITVAGPPGITPDVCAPQTLYTQVKRGTLIQPAPQHASEIFDIGVQAQVFALNPNLSNLPTSDVALAPGSPGASDGDPRYTRDRRFFLSVNGRADCAHLKSLSVAGGAPLALAADSFQRQVDLPGDATPGDHSFDILVADQLDNLKTWSFGLTYDPANTDTTGAQPNADGLPVLGSGASFSAADASSIIVPLAFKDISVTDNLYGRREGLPAGRQFWGLLLSNTISPTVSADDPSLRWYPVRVPAPTDTFTVTWDLFSGLGFTSDLSNRPGDYYVYTRFLDGAGNPSREALKAKIVLLPGYSLAENRLPAILR